MIQQAERGYRWGKFQAWASLVLGLVQFILQRSLLASIPTLVLLIFLFTGLRHKRRYGFVLVYVVAGLSLLGGAYELVVQGGERLGAIVISLCFWGIPAALYYPKRYREFGVGGGSKSVPTTVESPKPAAVETTQAVVASSGGEDGGIRRVGYEEWREAIARARVEKMRKEKQ